MTDNSMAISARLDRVKHDIKRFFGPWGVFFKGFVKHPVMVGSIIPSSRRTINKMLAPVQWDECKLFVEYGPGVGTFCQPVLDRMRNDATLLVIDTNPDFIAFLNKHFRDSRFIAVHGSAADVNATIREFGFEHADYCRRNRQGHSTRRRLPCLPIPRSCPRLYGAAFQTDR
jgi:phosphatidylethanolamine/phosphatidyl-N-methylethanolamine N-methyltransferase